MTQDVAALRRQLQQLEELHAAGALDDAVHERSKAALERKLVDLVMSGAPLAEPPPAASPAEARRPSRRLLAAVGSAVVVIAAAGYWWTGAPGQAGIAPATGSTAGAEAGANGGHTMSFEQIADMADKLARRLEEQPNDAEGWAMLARSYSVLGRPADALPAYEKAVALRPDDATLLADHADALAVKNKGSLAGEPMKLVARALKADPGNLKALSLAATDAFDRKDYAGALVHWDHIVRLGPADSPLVQQAKSGIAEARELGKLLPTAATATATATAASAPVATAGPGVSGSVAIAAALAGRVGPDDTVFVFARAAEGARTPLAVLRKKVRDLPFDFRLDDSMAMAESLRLSSAGKLTIGVRVTKSGDAVPAAGDLVGQAGPVALGASGVKIEIDTVRK